MAAVKLDKELIYGFAGSMLSQRYDEPKPTPDFHFDLWELMCDEHPYVAAAAPRHHAKSTAITHAYVLANVLFGIKTNVMILSDTQEQAAQFLYDIKVELTENKVLIEYFNIKHILKDNQKELVVEMGEHGHMFRIFAKGTDQSLRGSKWRGRRPDLVVGDDMENDEMVLSKDRRNKIKKWFLAALLPILSDDGNIRIVGTILHEDSLLESLLKSKHWKSHRWEAHNDDFSFILWPEKHPEIKLRALMEYYKEQGEYEIYLQEYRNIPIDDSIAIFRSTDFRPIPKECVDNYLEYYIGVDCATSTRERADYTVFFVVGVNKDGKILVKDVVRGRFDSLETVDKFFELEETYHPEMFIVEDENISKTLGPFMYDEMAKRRRYFAIETMIPSKDLVRRSKSWVARMRSGNVYCDTEAEWYEDYRAELKAFPRSKHDDQVSASSLVGLKLAAMVDADESLQKNFDDDHEYEEDYYESSYEEEWSDDDINGTTGY